MSTGERTRPRGGQLGVPPLRTVEVRFTPADRTQAETTALWQVEAGERVLFVSVKKLILGSASSTGTLDVGDGDDADGYAAGIALGSGTAGDLADGRGTYAQLEAAKGKLYNATDTVDAVYTPGATPGTVTPVVAVRLTLYREWPS